MTTKTKRPPADRGQGRKSLQGAGKSPVLQVRVTPAQKSKVELLGGPEWMRKMIDDAIDLVEITKKADQFTPDAR